MNDQEIIATLDQGGLRIHLAPVIGARQRELLLLEVLPYLRGPDGVKLDGDRLWLLARREHRLVDLSLGLAELTLRHWMRWQAAGRAACMAFSLPHFALRDARIRYGLLEKLRSGGLPPEKIQFKLGEADLLHDVVDGFELARSLRREGLAAGMGVFGAEHARYLELDELPFDALWIRPEYTVHLEHDPLARKVVDSAIRLSRAHELPVIAQGVSLERQWSLLESLGCTGMQGDLTGGALAPEDVLAWWRPVGARNEEPATGKAKAIEDRSAGAAPGVALIVDDDPIVRGLLQHQLALLGFEQCLSASDGNEAMQVLERQPKLELIFCDLKMPGMDGIEFLRHAAERVPHVKVVLVSSVDARIMRSAASLARAHHLQLLGTLDKPVRLETLRAIMAKLDRKTSGPEPASQRSFSQQELQQALANKEIVAFFQPQVDVESGRLVGAEALVRWRHAQGLVMPGQFLPLAMESGLINPMTEAMLESALEAMENWKQCGLDLTVSVNLTMDILSELDFPDRLSARCQQQGIETRRLMLEITESGAMRDPVVTLDVVTRLRMRGFSLSIDDFGTGYSSLSQLREIPFNELKIDQSFVSIAHLDDEARRIVENNIRLARNLHMHSVAEGVETIEDWRLLRRLDCDVLQGFFISRAMAADDFLRWAQGEYAQRLASGELPPAI